MSDAHPIAKRTSAAEKLMNVWVLLLMVYPLLGIPAIYLAGAHLGWGAGIIVGIVILFGFFAYLRRIYRWADKIHAQRRGEIRETYRGIYRVKGAPSSKWSWLKENVRIGDYAWERPPWRRDNLIYLQGLQDQWGVVWMAGFRREDVEYIAPKPVSEFDWADFDYDGPRPIMAFQWGRAKAKSPCPFAVNTENRKIYKWRFPG